MWNYFFPRCFLLFSLRQPRNWVFECFCTLVVERAKKHTLSLYFLCVDLCRKIQCFFFGVFYFHCCLQLLIYSNRIALYSFNSVRFGFESSFSNQHFIHALSSLFIIIYLFSLVEFFSLSFSCVRSLYAFCRLFGSFSYSISAIRLGESESVDGKKWMCFLFFFQCVKW